MCALCASGDKDAIRNRLKHPKTNVNETDSTGETPLHKACQAGDIEVIQLLLAQNGIDIWRKSNDGRTPLHVASKYGYVKAAELLLGEECDENEDKSYVNITDYQGLTPLCYSAKFCQGIQKREMVMFLQARYVTVKSIRTQ